MRYSQNRKNRRCAAAARKAGEAPWSRRSPSKSISWIRPPRTTGGRPWWTWLRQRPRSSTPRLTDFGEQRLAMMDQAGIARAVLSIAGPGVQAERDTATAVRNARDSNDLLAAEVQKRPDRYSGFAHLAMQDAESRRRRARALRARAQVLRRHDQRPHQRQVSRRPLLRSVLGAGRGVGCADLSASGRSGGAVAGARRLQRAGASDLGLGRRDRLACAAPHLRRRVPSLPEGQALARPSRRDAAVPALALRQPLEALRLELAEAARRNTCRRTSG